MPSKFPCLGQKKLKYDTTYPCSNGFLQSFIKLCSHKYAEAQCRDYVCSPCIPFRRAVSIDPRVLQFVDDVVENSDAETTDTVTSSSGDCSL